jgi:hypothetical protein
MRVNYVIDTCALIDASNQYNISKKSFAFIWEKFDDLIEGGELISSEVVKDELTSKDLEDLQKWAKKHKTFFYPLTKEIQEKTKEVLAKYPSMIGIKGTGNSNADPFLIATALSFHGTIVTQEKRAKESAKVCKIPNACDGLGIPYMDLQTFLDLILD